MVCLEENIQCHFEKEGLLWKHSLINPGRLLLLFSFLSHMSVLHLQMLGPALDSGSGEESEQNPSWYRPYVLGRGDRKWSTTPLIKRCNGRDAVSNGEITRQTPPDSETSLWAAESLILTLPRSQMVWNMMNYPACFLALVGLHGDLRTERDPGFPRWPVFSSGVTPLLFPIHICPSRTKPV